MAKLRQVFKEKDDKFANLRERHRLVQNDRALFVIHTQNAMRTSKRFIWRIINTRTNHAQTMGV